jgi:hypothetical protein
MAEPNKTEQPEGQPKAVPVSPAAANSSRGLIGPDKIYQSKGSGLNLMNPIRIISTDPEPGFWKPIILDVSAVLFAAAFSYSFARYLAGGFSFWLVFAALLLWSAAAALEGFLQKSASRRFAIIFLESFALVAFFYAYAWQALAITGVLVLLVLLWGYFSVRRELRNAIEIRFFVASGKVVGKIITAAVIFMVVMYASLSNNNGNFFVSEHGFDVFFNWAAGFVNNFYPTPPLTGSFGDFAQAVARMQLQGNPQFQSLTARQQNDALAQSASQLMRAFAPAPSASEPASNAFYDYFSAAAAKLQNKFNNLFIGVWGLALFLILRSVGIIVVWAGQFVALVFYELMLATGFIRIKEQSATKETIEY